jgi:hypothetical protein
MAACRCADRSVSLPRVGTLETLRRQLKRVLHVEEQSDSATAVLYRRMSDEADPVLYELRMRRVEGSWPVTAETVLPWPDLTLVKGFLPPRRK